MLMRHGDALNTRPDAIRALSPVGMNEVRANAMRLLEVPWRPSVIIHSPLRRAAETAKLVANCLDHGSPLTTWDELAPNGDCRYLLRKLAESGGESLLLVTHQPLIGTFIEYLTSESVRVGTAYIAGIQLDEFLPSTGQLSWFLDTPA
ncbi:MAG: phosphohistidine phosphatase [Candidatus Azotimanducaceae bacterium]|jgi:phosphohistidine phosphatase